MISGERLVVSLAAAAAHGEVLRTEITPERETETPCQRGALSPRRAPYRSSPFRGPVSCGPLR